MSGARDGAENGSSCFHWSQEYRDSLTNKTKGEIGEHSIVRILSTLKNELDLLASEPFRLAHLQETDDIPDIYVEGWNRGFLLEVKNWFAPAKYDLATVRANVDKDWDSMEYPVRMTSGIGQSTQRRRGTITMKNNLPAVPILVVTQVNTWRPNARKYVVDKFGNDLILTDHPFIPERTIQDAECN